MKKILVVEDEAAIRLNVTLMLKGEGYEVDSAENGRHGVEHAQRSAPDLIVSDVMMPELDGFGMLEALRADSRFADTPFIFLTALNDRTSKRRGMNLGADDFLNKPVDPQELFARVKSLLKLKQFTDDLENAETVLFSLALGVEARDPYTEGHCSRLADYASSLGRAMRLSEEDVIALRRGGVLHDIGKIAVPDAILRKPGPLNAEETRVLRRHPVVGEQICHPLRTLHRVLPIIRHHHEHWNGHGYPDGLAGESIPLLARVLQVADAYDALTTDRPYKPAWSHDEAKAILLSEARDHWWDESIVRIFLHQMDENLRKHRRAG